jgi:Collagen triple helix repeat (20 copies)
MTQTDECGPNTLWWLRPGSWPGPPGPQGPAGLQGPSGPIGPQGPIGPMGPQGIEGEQGPAGTSINIIGSLDDPSELPPTGNVGDGYLIQGDLWVWSETTGSWVNAGSIQGPPGPAGPQGSQGPQGPIGFTGPQGIQGQTGATGSPGPQGNTGPQGPIGLTGPQGTTGTTGATGPQGPIGDTGIQGPIGLTGPQGPQGATGPAGPNNPNLPLGYLASGMGPSSTINFQAISSAFNVGVAAQPNRWYMVVGQGNGQQITTAATSVMRIRDPSSVDWIPYPSNLTLAVNATVNTTITGYWQAPSSWTPGATALFQFMVNALGGAFQIVANACRMAVFDMGIPS